MFKIWPCQSIGEPGNYVVAEPGDSPIFINGAYNWSKDEAEVIARLLNQEIYVSQIPIN